jgi:hypothetical protein
MLLLHRFCLEFSQVPLVYTGADKYCTRYCPMATRFLDKTAELLLKTELLLLKV